MPHSLDDEVVAPATVIAAGYSLHSVVDGSFPQENPFGFITNFGFLSTGTLIEPDENAYFSLEHQSGRANTGF